MNKTELNQLKQDARDTMDAVRLSEMTKEKFILMGSCMGILRYDEPVELASGKSPNNRSPKYLAMDELESAEMYLEMGLREMASDELRHAMYWMGELRKIAITQEDHDEIQRLTARYEEIARKM